MDVIKMLQSKNRCLQRMLDLSDRFVREGGLCQLDSQLDSQSENHLDAFLRERDVILKALDLYDRKVTEAIATLPASERSEALIFEVQSVLAEKDRLVQAIIAKDNELTTQIEDRKKKLMENIASSRRSHEMVGKFKSTWVTESGEELDKTL